ncbi:MAG: response regulator transcription factor [Deltaproteobacteria bacterium]|nr:response regulator transcription factor [Deltaproteobacteria bacterium]
MSTILIIEDDQSILTGLVDNLSMEGYRIKTAGDGKAGLKAAEEGGVDLIILDIMMPGMDGFQVCRHLREKGDKTPVIILSARGQETDKVLGLQLGADDYVAKPFNVQELLMRIKAVLRRTTAPEPQVATFGNLKFDFQRYEVTKDGKPLKLTANEFTILKLLVQNPGIPVSRHKILADIWGEGATSRTVDTHIWNLREKLEDDPSHPVHIVTVQRIGYKFVP